MSCRHNLSPILFIFTRIPKAINQSSNPLAYLINPTALKPNRRLGTGGIGMGNGVYRGEPGHQGYGCRTDWESVVEDRTRPPPGAASNWLFPAGRVAFYSRTAGFLKNGSVALLHRILHRAHGPDGKVDDGRGFAGSHGGIESVLQQLPHHDSGLQVVESRYPGWREPRPGRGGSEPELRIPRPGALPAPSLCPLGHAGSSTVPAGKAVNTLHASCTSSSVVNLPRLMRTPEAATS